MRKTLIVAFSALIIGACVSGPQKPVVEVGAIDYSTLQIIAGLSDGSDAVHRAPLSTYDKATCFKPDAWEQLKVYVESLSDYAARCSKGGSP